MSLVWSLVRSLFVVALAVMAAEPCSARASLDRAPSPVAETHTDITNISAQSRRPRTTIRVYPKRAVAQDCIARHVPGCMYPGTSIRRECKVRYVSEARPSGVVIVPDMHCWWVRN